MHQNQGPKCHVTIQPSQHRVNCCILFGTLMMNYLKEPKSKNRYCSALSQSIVYNIPMKQYCSFDCFLQLVEITSMVGHSSEHDEGECKSQLGAISHTRYKEVFQTKSIEKFDFDTVSQYLPTDPHLGQDMSLYFVNIYSHISIRKQQTTKYFRI